MNIRLGILSQKISIRNQIIFLVLIILILPLLFTFYYLDKPLEKAIKAKIGYSAQEALKLAGRNIEYATEEMFAAANEIAQSPRVIQLLQDPEALTPYEKYELQISELNKVSRSNHTSFVAVMDNIGHMTTSRYTEPQVYNEIMRSDWLAHLNTTPNQLLWVFRQTNYTFADKRPTVSLVRLIQEPQTHRKLGVLLYSKSEEDLYSYITGLEGKIYLADSSGTIISSGDKSKLGAALPTQYAVMDLKETSRGQATVGKGAEKKLVNYYGISQTGWTIVQIIPYDTVFKEIFDIRKANLTVSGMILALFVLLTIAIANNISRPLVVMVKKMTGMENNQFNSPITVNGPKEISVLQKTYNQMLGQLKDLLHRVKDEYKQKEEMRFRALQAQINPHFILNTLNNIKWTAYVRGEREVGQMLSSLAGLLEGSIVRGSSMNTLGEEVDYLRNYIVLMKLKFNEKLDIVFNVPEDLLQAETIKFMLQPVVENSIEHGLERLPGKGVIEVKAHQEGGILLLTISDNGIGIGMERLKELQTWLDADELVEENDEAKRIGLRNVHERLRLQYGEGFGLAIDSRPGEGATVTFRLPFLRKKEGQKHAD
ncbi:sensor histidine kinase [Paenibacillus nasutitermitis]|uniref:Histidine kinase n=1 Tax=Paenibacillus nasutitermitis TaxID=1652958 RepID=A0A916YTE3_9BACL|nr:sensor histidine kinase [Paenibacillus nasutitermitis]GGD59234.1 histidine kinase [Paenibacillus nasutitermitis]